MKKIFLYILTVIWIIPAVSLLNGCKKFVEIDPPETKVESVVVFSNDATAISAMIGLYTRMATGNLVLYNGAISIIPALSADELVRNTALAAQDAFTNNSVPTNSSLISAFWAHSYSYIYHANAILEGLDKSTGVTTAAKTQLAGEAKFIRAFIYFYLVNLFGDVPLITGTNFEVNALLPRSPVAQVYSQIIKDLTDAQNQLPVSYITTPAYPNSRVRANKAVATAMLARVYLYQKEWANAETQSTAIISAPTTTYRLDPALNNVFKVTSTNPSLEAIWQLMPVGTFNTSEGNLLNTASTTGKPTYSITGSLNNSFEANDQRKINWLKTNGGAGMGFPYPYKYTVRTGGAPYTEYNMVLRVAEQFLIRAEARAKQNNLSGAIADLNMVRARAGLPNLSSSLTQNEVLTAVEQERRVELFVEWGHRWFDLKRTNRADAVLGLLKGSNWQSTDVLYPIPLAELQRNPNLVQNPGY